MLYEDPVLQHWSVVVPDRVIFESVDIGDATQADAVHKYCPQWATVQCYE